MSTNPLLLFSSFVSFFFFSSLTFSIQKVRRSRCVILRKDRRFDSRLLIYAIRFNFQPSLRFCVLIFRFTAGWFVHVWKFISTRRTFLFQRRPFLSATIDLSIFYWFRVNFISLYYIRNWYYFKYRIFVNKFVSNYDWRKKLQLKYKKYQNRKNSNNFCHLKILQTIQDEKSKRWELDENYPRRKFIKYHLPHLKYIK